MSVANDRGWAGDGVSPSDAMFEAAWSGKRVVANARVEITEGPLAVFRAGVDPVKETERLRQESALAMRTKTARVSSGGEEATPINSPSQNRVIQDEGRMEVVEQTRRSASTNPVAPQPKPTSAPTAGALMKKVRERQAATKNVTTKPETRADDLAKVSEAQLPFAVEEPPFTLTEAPSDNDVNELLKLAGVPSRALPQTSALWQVAVEALTKAGSDALLTRDDIHPLKLLATLDDALGSEWREWEPETIIQSIAKVAGHEISEPVANKIMAMKLVLQRPDVFYDRWDAMEKICVAFNDIAPTMGTAEDVAPEWLSNAVAIVTNMVPGDFGSDVTAYVAARLYDSGYVVAPPLLRFADAKLGELVSNDPLRKKVILAYAAHLGDPEPMTGEDPVAIQVSRIMGHHAYVLDKFDQSREQLSS